MNTRSTRAFTLIELIIVVTIIVLLIAILLPALGVARSQARAAKCSANLHSIGTAAQTRLVQMTGISGAKSMGLLELLPLMNNDTHAFVCPEDNPGTMPTIFDAEIAVYNGYSEGAVHPSPPPSAPGFQYYMHFDVEQWVYKCDLGGGSYAYNFEDQQYSQNGGDKSFYNFYVKCDPVPGGINMTSERTAPAGDVKPPGATGGPGVGGGYTFDLVKADGVTILRDPWSRDDHTPFFMPAGGCSYGMNALYPDPSAMTSPSPNVFIVIDYLVPAVSLAGPNAVSGEWHDELYPDPTKVGDRPAMNRHRGRFNALLNDYSVRINILPASVDPSIAAPAGTPIRQKWWGGN